VFHLQAEWAIPAFALPATAGTHLPTTKPSITIASVDRFYLNLVICLQLDMALLVQNSVKIWHCLSKLWQCTQGVTFFPGHSVYIKNKVSYHKQIVTPHLSEKFFWPALGCSWPCKNFLTSSLIYLALYTKFVPLFRAGNSAWLMMTVYRPGSCYAIAKFFEELSAVLETLVTHGCPVIFGGD